MAVFLISALSWFFFGGPILCDAQATNTIKQGQVLTTSEKMLVSANGRFQLGFFDLGFPPKAYLAIRYTRADYDHLVWVANRDKPLDGGDNATALTLEADGLLKITRNKGDPIPLNFDRTARNATAVLENSGNLAVKELNPDGTPGRVLWESFDFPTDTLLPGMNHGANFTSGKKWVLSSWLSSENPAPGPFTLEYRPSSRDYGRVLVTRARPDLFLTSDEDYPVETIFDSNHISFVSNRRESYFRYSPGPGDRIISLELMPDSAVKYGNGTDSMIRKIRCFDTPSLYGCFDKEPPQCRTRKDQFTLRQGRFLGNESWPTWHSDSNSSLGLNECFVRCWRDCSCVGYDSLNFNGTGCRFWNAGAEFEQSYSGSESQLRILSSRFPIPDGKTGQKWWLWVIISLACFTTIAVVLVFFCYQKRKRLQEKKEESILKELTNSDGFNNKEEIINFDPKKGHDLKLFSFASISAATDNFSYENKLGQGGFGPVFKGKLPEGQEIAVKRLSRSSGQGLMEFKNELILIAKLQHMNLVRLLGCCVRGDEKMLIYEYMPNKSLDFFLFDPKRRKMLDWEKRYNVIEGVAQGILYLHRYSRLRIIHRDLKASNILLDKDMKPNISDFGMARIFGRNESEANTNRIVGTYGYMPPEYAMEGNFSEKSDVYSFGVLLLEIISGQRNNGFYNPDRPVNLIGYAWELWKKGRSKEIIDPTLPDHSTSQQVVRCVHVGLLCVQDNASDRPNMADVLSMISNHSLILPVPKQVTVIFQNQSKEANSSGQKQESPFVSASITDLEPR